MNEYDILKANAEIQKLIDNGTPVVDLSIFDFLYGMKVNDKVNNQVEYTTEIYLELLEKIQELSPELREKYLLTLKNADVIDNQSLEKEDSFLISLYRSFNNKTALDLIIENKDKKLSKEDFILIHDTLLKGTSSSEKIGLRDNNLKFVGSLKNGERYVQYFPILNKNIDSAVTKFLDIYNTDNPFNFNNDSVAFLNSIIYHGLIATLQLFKDGNTRYARLLQHVSLWNLLNKNLNKDIELPILYATRQYFAYRNQYRDLIKDIAVSSNQESWNNWIIFNLHRLQDNIYYSDNNIEKIKMRVK